MSGFNFRAEVRSAALVAIAPVLPALLVVGKAQEPLELLRSSQLVAYTLVFAAAVFVYIHWRTVNGSPAKVVDARLSGWLVVSLAIVAAQGLALAALLDPASTPRSNAWPMIFQLVLLLVLAAAVLAAESFDVPRDPALTGIVALLLLVSLLCLAAILAPPLPVSSTSLDLLNSLMMLAGLLVAWTVLQLRQVVGWARRHLAIAVVLLCAAQFIANLGDDGRGVTAVAVVLNLQGALVLCISGQSLLRRSVVDYQEELKSLQATLAQVRADVLGDRELLHEVGSAVAGIITASRVMDQDTGISPQRRQRLEHMVSAEIGRLDRLMSDRSPAVSRPFAVDDVVEQLVTGHQERGLDVHWTPTDTRAFGEPDDFAEVVNILLENARRHGGRTVHVEVAERDGFVELVCSDDGPGVSAEILPQLFTSGVRGPDSPGQGLGLSIAQRLMSDRGGSLELADSGQRGATFVARLPRNEMAHAASHHVA
jgi:signal transduction histidine kinase